MQIALVSNSLQLFIFIPLAELWTKLSSWRQSDDRFTKKLLPSVFSLQKVTNTDYPKTSISPLKHRYCCSSRSGQNMPASTQYLSLGLYKNKYKGKRFNKGQILIIDYIATWRWVEYKFQTLSQFEMLTGLLSCPALIHLISLVSGLTNLASIQWRSTFIMLWAFIIVPHVVVTYNHKIISMVTS